MSKITIVSRPDQHLLIDISACHSFRETIEQLSTALLNANQLWQGITVDLNLGRLMLNKSQLAQILALTKGVGINAKSIFAEHQETAQALKELEAALEVAGNAANKEDSLELSSVALFSENGEISIAENGLATKLMAADDNKVAAEPNSEDHALSQDNRKTFYESENCSKSSEILMNVDNIVTGASNHDTSSPVEQTLPNTGKRQSLYIKQTLRAGQAVSHKGDLIIIGDVNAGAEVLAEGDIVVWGSLRGIAHAGVGGNTKAEIRALRLQPIQLRIAHYIARSPDTLQTSPSITTASAFMAETAKLVDGKIRILREIFD